MDTAELAQWKRLQEIGRRLENLPENNQLESLQDKHRLLKGVLYWQASASYKPRLWQAKQQLGELDKKELRHRWQRAYGSAPPPRLGGDMMLLVVY